MDECFLFPWENLTRGEIVIENAETNLTSHPNKFQVLDLVSQECTEVEVASTEQASNQVTEEFVIDQWDGSCVEEVVGSEQDQAQDVEIPLSTDQDEYISSRQYPCDFCSRRFKKEINLINHMAAHKRAHRSYECTDCGIKFDKQSELLIHQTLHDYPTEPENKLNHAQPFVCELCGVGFAKEKALTSHLRIHEGDSPFACKQCNQAFWDKNSMEDHWKVFHAPIDDNHRSTPKAQSKFGTYCCTTCGISFCRQNDLKRHQLNHVKEEMTNSALDYLCTVCGESFSDTFELLCHTEEMHGDGFEYHCMICGENFIDEDAQLEHVRNEHPESEVLHCQTKDMWRRKARPRQRRSNINEEFSKELSQSKPSSDHPFACSLCSKKFTTRSSQQIHMRIHTGERPYACRFCHKAFADGGTLRKHERIHTGEKPYACVICPKAFNQRVVLREHIRSHHSSPDPEHSHTTTPYCCAVCSDKFVASQDLMVHLIHHCDTNTALKRPPRIGPRKYVRRRKLKSYEFEPEEELSEEEVPQFQSGVTPKYEIVMDTRCSNMKESSTKRNHRRTQEIYARKEYPVLESSPTGSETQSEMETKEDHIENSVPSLKSKAKMIFTEKKRKYIEMPKFEAKRQKREKYTKKTYTESEGSGRENIKPRQKNTNHHTSTHEKLPMAICPEEESAVDNLLKLCKPFHKENNELLKSCKIGPQETIMEQTEEYTNTYNPNVIEENKKIVTRRSSRKTKGLSPRNRFLENDNEEFETGRRRRTKSDTVPPEINVKEEYEVCEEQIVYENPEDFVVYETNNADEVTTEAAVLQTSDPEIQETIVDQSVPLQQEMIDPLLEFAEISMQHAKSIFKCELCSSVFLERAQLLAHVRVHI